MHRNPILELIRDYRGTYPEERSTVDRMVKFVNDHDDCFERSQLLGHITGSCWLLNTSASAVLLTHHRKLDIWVQLGGHADGETNVLEAALTEAREESGLAEITVVDPAIFDIDIHEIPARKDDPAHFHYDCRFLLQAVNSDEFVISEESHDLQWVELNELEKYSSEASILRMREKYLRRFAKA